MPEFWLVDARRELFFCLHRRGDTGYQAAPVDDESYQYSAVLNGWYRLDRTRNPRGRLQYTPARKTWSGQALHVAWRPDDAAPQVHVLTGNQVEPRREFIEKHALAVRNLDV